jgi:hypothetical protein
VQIHLRCPRCPRHFSAPADTPTALILETMTEDAPWFVLPEGVTFEAMVFSALARRGRLRCPRCRGPALAGGETLGRASAAELRRAPRPRDPGKKRG